MQLSCVVLQNLHALRIGAVDHVFDFLVDLRARLLGIGLGTLVIPSNKNLVVVVKGHRADTRTHAELRNHIVGNLRRTLQVV